MSKPLFYIFRHLLFIGIIVTGLWSLHEQLANVFYNNIWMNTAIISTLAVGVFLTLYQLAVLVRENQWLRAFSKGEEGFPGTSKPKLLEPIANLNAHSTGTLNAFNVQASLSSVDARLEEFRDFNRYLVGLLVFLGLLGTFWGLSLTISAIAGVISGIDVGATNIKDAFQTLKQGLQSPLTGMGTAFSSSMFGLGGSLILGFLDVNVSKASRAFYHQLEEKMQTLMQSRPYTQSMTSSGPAYMQGMLEFIAEHIAQMVQLLRQNEENRLGIVQVVQQHCQQMSQLTEAVLQMKKTAANLLDTQEQTEILKRLEVITNQLLNSRIEGQEKLITELKQEIRLVTRTLSAIANGQDVAA